jgi:hypothetical protein
LAARATRSVLPAKSPIVGLICASAIRIGLFILTGDTIQQ